MLKELRKDERGVIGDIIGLVITGVIVTYVLVIFMSMFLPDLFTVIDATVGVSLAGTVKFILGAMLFFLVLGLIVRIWGMATGNGGTPQQY
jgi:phosphotransferase system  glucose/maltose/N-acetylglucosamine-specific IIC component